MATAEKLEQYRAEKIVIDPVMVATSGAKLISDDAIDTLKGRLLPMADMITPNIPEAEVLSGNGRSTQRRICASCRKYQQQISVRGSGKGRTPAE